MSRSSLGHRRRADIAEPLVDWQFLLAPCPQRPVMIAPDLQDVGDLPLGHHRRADLPSRT
jgi:hypothetical protein